MKPKHFNHIISIAGLICFLILAVGSEGDSSEEDSLSAGPVSDLTGSLVESQVSFLEELDRRITDFYKRKDSVKKKVRSEENPHRNPGVDWKEYHNFLYEQIKWLTNTSYNKFYKSDVDGWKAKITQIYSNSTNVPTIVGVYGNPQKKVGFKLRFSSTDMGKLDVGGWVQFSGSWDTSPREGEEWTIKDSKPILGEYVRYMPQTTVVYGMRMDSDGRSIDPKDYVYYTEKHIGQIGADSSDDAEMPVETSRAESLLEKLYRNGNYDYEDIVFIIKVKSCVML